MSKAKPLDQHLKLAIESAIADRFHSEAEIASTSSVGGGCINRTERIKLQDGRKFFLKTKSNSPDDWFAREAEGLAAIAATGVIKVPDVIGYGDVNGTQFLIQENVESAGQDKDFFGTFGEQLARLHQSAASNKFGFSHANYIGSTVQPNLWSEDWVEFWREQRFEFQFDLARKNGYGSSTFSSLADRILNRLEGLIASDECPALIHGDLWSGNFMIGANTELVLIDPAAYFGNREAEFGMTTLFGGFPNEFYRRYDEVWPLENGFTQRIEIYRLYHLLNHLNLFGSTYMNGCMEIMNKYA